MLIEPSQKLSNTSRREGYAGIRRAVVEINGVAICANRGSAGEGDIAYVSIVFV